MRERKGVLTTTISRAGHRIERLSGEVAGIRGREAAVHGHLLAKQRDLDLAVVRLGLARGSYRLGPHVHFEVRVNGAVTDPMGYL